MGTFWFGSVKFSILAYVPVVFNPLVVNITFSTAPVLSDSNLINGFSVSSYHIFSILFASFDTLKNIGSDKVYPSGASISSNI